MRGDGCLYLLTAIIGLALGKLRRELRLLLLALLLLRSRLSKSKVCANYCQRGADE